MPCLSVRQAPPSSRPLPPLLTVKYDVVAVVLKVY